MVTMMKTLDDYKVGDVLLHYNRGFLPRQIRNWMAKYQRKYNLPDVDRYYNHASCVVNIWGEKMKTDSGARGVQAMSNINDYINNPNVLHLTWRKPLTEEEQRKFSKVAVGFSLKITRYDYRNFLDWIWFITTGKWWGKKGEKSKKKVYCSEFVAIVMDSVRGSFDGQTWNVSPYDLQISQDLVEVK